MCEPTLIVTAAATAVSAFGAVSGGYAQQAQHNYASRVADNNAAQAMIQAADAEDRGRREEVKHWRDVARLKSQQIVSSAASGFETFYGTPADAIADTAVMGALDASTLRENATREAYGYTVNASNFRADASAQTQAGKNAVRAGWMEGASTLLAGASQYMGQQAPKARGGVRPGVRGGSAYMPKVWQFSPSMLSG